MPPRISLPPVPSEFAGDPVAAWSEALTIDTYPPEEPSPYPAFLDSRVYQGSSGRVYPLPFHERISQHSEPHEWQAVHLENEWVRLVILPEIGGRIYIGYDKVADYDFFYRNNVIKPALVGLAGPWVSGGVEFNWPQHHRPGTFLPTDVEIEREDDGAITVWCSDHDPFTRMKGMQGIRLRPDSSVIEARVRLYNRSDETQTFLWWANVAAAVNDDYQSFFPTDVAYVADHAKRALATFPRVNGTYYGVDYPARVTADHPDADRLDWYRNIPVPTSYMVAESKFDFFGGYDHGKNAGFVHWADHHVAPGKKQWTWGNSEFGWAWDRNLTDGDGPYIELMAGVFTDNQPDFSFITPGETKTFSQYWYPIQQIGPAQQATLHAALHLEVIPSDHGSTLDFGVAATRIIAQARIEMTTSAGEILFDEQTELRPGKPFLHSVVLPHAVEETTITARVWADDQVILEWAPRPQPAQPPRLATEPAEPAEIGSSDELFFTGQYLEQYHHATRMPEPYWQEILARDPQDVRANVALGAAHDRAHRYTRAEANFRAALTRQLERVPNPSDGEAHYRLGINLVRQGKDGAALEYLSKAQWNSGWFIPASYALGKLYARRQQWTESEKVLRSVVERDPAHLQATCLLAIVLRRRAADQEATDLLIKQLSRDPLDQWTRDLLSLPMTVDAPTVLDIAVEYASVGLSADALRLLDVVSEMSPSTPVGQVNVGPLALYHRARVLSLMGENPQSALDAARTSNARHCLPSRLEDVDALQHALDADPQDSAAASLLGSWHYSRGNYELAVTLWTRALISPTNPESAAIAHRNLGIAMYNIRRNSLSALGHFESARRFAPDDAKLLFEYDQLRIRSDVPSADRRALLESRSDLVAARDDLTIAFVNLLIESNEANRAESILRSRVFQPWEGGEGQVLAAWDAVKISQFNTALRDGDAQAARRRLSEATDYPQSLGEGRHPLANRAQLQWLIGVSEKALGHDELAERSWEAAASYFGDFVGMSTQKFSDQTYWSIMALTSLGRVDEAKKVTRQLAEYASQLATTPATLEFFATSLPSLLLFHDDPNKARRAVARTILGQVESLHSKAFAEH